MSILSKSDLSTILLHIGTQVQDLWGHWQKSDNYLNIILWSSFNYLTCSGFLVLSSGWERALPTERWVVVVFVTFLLHFWNYWRPLLAFDDFQRPFLKHKCDKNVTWENFSVSFLTHFWIGFCHILNTFLFFVSFLSDFEQFLLDFCHIFVF